MLPLRRALASARPSTLRAQSIAFSPSWKTYAPSSLTHSYATTAEQTTATETPEAADPATEQSEFVHLPEEEGSEAKKWSFAELVAERKANEAAKNDKSSAPKASASQYSKRAAPAQKQQPAAKTPAAKSSPAPETAPKKTNGRPSNGATTNSSYLPSIPHKDLHNAWNETTPDKLSETDWRTSYKGISEKPVYRQTADILLAPLVDADVEVKPDGIIYLPEIKYRRRLTEAFGPMGWGLIPRGDPVVGDSIVTREYCLIVDGRFVAQAQGENQYFGNDQLPSAVEGCKSNALMRCCKDLGIASELWDPAYIRWFRQNHMESRWVENTVTKKKKQFWFKKGVVEVAYPWKVTK